MVASESPIFPTRKIKIKFDTNKPDKFWINGVEFKGKDLVTPDQYKEVAKQICDTEDRRILDEICVRRKSSWIRPMEE
jgi:hypothetical protein